MQPAFKYTFGYFVVVTLLTGSGMWGSVLSANVKTPQQRVTQLPPVVSHVQRLRVKTISVQNDGTPNAIIIVEIENDSDLSVTCVDLSTKTECDSSGITTCGSATAEGPPAIAPRGTTKLEMPVTNLLPGAPLVISAAFFGDGSEDGDAWALKAIKLGRERRQTQQHAAAQANRP